MDDGQSASIFLHGRGDSASRALHDVASVLTRRSDPYTTTRRLATLRRTQYVATSLNESQRKEKAYTSAAR